MRGFGATSVCILFLIASSSGCTIMTSCPAGQTQGSGNTGNTGNTGQSGSSGSGGGDGTAGTTGTAPNGTWINETSNLAATPSECGGLGLVSAKPDEDLLIAGIAQNGLWSSTDGGDSWTQFGDSAAIKNRITAIVYDPVNTMSFWEAGTYNLDGVYQTTDDGSHFVSEGISNVDFFSPDFGDPDRQTQLAGGHEQPQTVYHSADGGKTWDMIGKGLPSDTFCDVPLVIDPSTYLVGCYGGHNGIYRSENAGTDWTSVSDNGGGAPPLVAQDGTIFWPSGAANGFVKSTDSGKTWSAVMAADTITNVAFVELPDHRIAAVGKSAVMISSDDGETWQAATSQLPFGPYSLTYSAQRKAFYISYFTCGNSPLPVPDNAVMRYDFE